MAKKAGPLRRAGRFLGKLITRGRKGLRAINRYTGGGGSSGS